MQGVSGAIQRLVTLWTHPRPKTNFQTVTKGTPEYSGVPYNTFIRNQSMTTTFADYCASADARNTIQLNVRKWTLMLCDALLDNFKSRNNNSSSDYKFYIEEGRKYHKVIMETGCGSRSVHCFVDKKTGSVYKPASWRGPAKGERCNLLIITEREWALSNADWAGIWLYKK